MFNKKDTPKFDLDCDSFRFQFAFRVKFLVVIQSTDLTWGKV